MMLPTLSVSGALCLPFFLAAVSAQALYNKPCPLLDVNLPNPSSYATSSVVQTAMKALQDSISNALTQPSTYGQFDSNTTAFSIDVYSLQDETSLFTYHFTPQDLISQHDVGVEVVDSDSVYRIGSVSKLYTVYIYLVAAGDETWNQPVAKFIPEIADYIEMTPSLHPENNIDTVDWNSITIGALASQMAGLPRDGAYSAVLEQGLESLGVPPPVRDESSMCGDDTRSKLPCNRTAFFQEYLLQHPIVSPFKTPIYGNAPYQILAYAIENITGTPMAELFEEAFVKPLELNSTYYTVPPSTNTSFIPGNASTSWWDADALDETPAGGYYSSINDMRKVGKSILNSTLLNPTRIRRWMKPHAFTSNVNVAVGAPWEIVRAPGDQVSWIYTKSGDFGAYAAWTALLPDYNVGFSVLAAGSDSVKTVQILSDITANALLPAIRSAAKEEAASIYTGTYTDSSTNSTITITSTDSDPGLVVTNWHFGGYDVLSLLGTLMGADPSTQNLTAHLYASGLTSENGTLVGWRAVYEVQPQPLDTGAFSTNCATWGYVDSLTYGGVGLDEFLFTIDAGRSGAVSIQPRVLGWDLVRATQGMAMPKLLRRVKSM